MELSKSFSEIISLKKAISVAVLLVPLMSYGMSGFADGLWAEVLWARIAFKYCLLFGILFFIGLLTYYHINKSRVNSLLSNCRTFLLDHENWSLIITGICVAIPVGLFTYGLYQMMSLLIIVPFFFISIFFIISLSFGKLRRKWLLNTVFLKLVIIISLSAILASILFTILSLLNLLPGLEEYIQISRGAGKSLEFTTWRHPFDSLWMMWQFVVFYMFVIPISLILMWIIKGFHFVFRKSFRRKEVTLF